MVREFAREEVAPVAAKFDADQEFPWENVQKMGELGLLGIPWPEELGGAGLDTLSYMIAIHEMAKVDASHGITISAHTTLGTSPIFNFGTPEQKERFVPLLATGKVLGGFGLTEPTAGSDAAGTRTTAIKRIGYYLLNGSKVFITHGGDFRRYGGYRFFRGNQGHFIICPYEAGGPFASPKERDDRT
jgi:butyryl-CoA dehydrogenase